MVAAVKAALDPANMDPKRMLVSKTTVKLAPLS